MNTSTKNHDPRLLVDLGAGVILDAPPTAIVDRRAIDGHPFIHEVGGELYAGPDVPRMKQGSGGSDYIVYQIDSEVAGFLRVTRTA